MHLQHRSTLALLTGLLSLGVSASSAQEAVAPVLAKTRLQPAAEAAKGWRADSVLIQVAARDVAEDGKQVVWDYGFWSAAAKTCLVVNVLPAGADTVESGGPLCESGAIGEFMDSDRAIQIAKSNGITKPKATMVVNATAGSNGSRTVWSVMDGSGMSSGDVILDLDASTGAVVNKTRQP